MCLRTGPSGRAMGEGNRPQTIADRGLRTAIMKRNIMTHLQTGCVAPPGLGVLADSHYGDNKGGQGIAKMFFYGTRLDRVENGSATHSGVVGGLNGFRRCRCAQPPATVWQSFRLRCLRTAIMGTLGETK
ncbi:MAG: hypothetical protein JWR19_2672 [Pedosphaera sp.]|nr:hypothetical protein [Pedosphaera sp.]